MDKSIKKESKTRKKPCRHCNHIVCDFRHCERWKKWFRGSYSSLCEGFMAEERKPLSLNDAADLIRRAQRL